ncbi:ArsR/SmtB family transcription factor [Amycolatopsis azurea]|uniref:Putative regulatory protein n=1 Tax=Amycolatopsis azurea DSM 43854 TaxID=1238180 RepID=M2NTT0_9PSEU|nr:winged helix-turn-helix domain-containing protein [Amycolatopsis azurea]EMD25889.1 Putative regulatory protein [Amycolatopsis azurea DSM 43854]OOC05834.1 transcriptional regulator [Amycolatopsis azurea DSM 43854]
MLRIHFTDQDLARVRVAAAPDPLWETVLALQKLVLDGIPVFAHWRRRVRREVHEQGSRGALRFLLALAPPARYFPDFLTPPESAGGLAAGLDALLGTPVRRLGHEIALLERDRRLPRWTSGVVAGDPAALRQVSDALRLAHDTLVVPQWSAVRTRVDTDRALRSRRAGEGGALGLLDSLRPVFRWEAPVLTARYPIDRDLYLRGRGLRLVPSYFCWDTPVALVDDDLDPVVVFPVSHDSEGTPVSRELAVLLGRTRAAVLHAVAGSCHGGELADRLGISATAVSRHTTVLREAGLITSSRDGAMVLHGLTPLGAALLG